MASTNANSPAPPAQLPLIFGFGNPLLDVSAEVPHEMFTKYDLKPGNAILAETKHEPLYAELVQNYKVDYIAGGATQNSIRAAQWMLQQPGATAYAGCIGKDDYGKHMVDVAAASGLTTYYQISEDVPTGRCAVLIHERERSLVAALGAANKFTVDWLQTEPVLKALRTAHVLYCAGFPLTVSPPATQLLGQTAAEYMPATDGKNYQGRVFAFNLSAPFLIEFFWEPMSKLLPYTDYIFSNEDEARTLGKKLGWGENIPEIAARLARWPKENGARARTVVFTQGHLPTIVVSNGVLSEHPVPPVPKAEIVDTNGAGDSFVGGFLAALALGRPLEKCVDAGHYCAGECIRRSGCTFPAKPSYAL